MNPKINITCKEKNHDGDFGITRAALNKHGHFSWSYLQRYRISTGEFVWHGFLNELKSETENYLMVSSRLAKAFGIEKPMKAEISNSNASEIQTIQYEQIDSEESTSKAVEGLQLQVGDICQFREKDIKITACYPASGYLTTRTNWEDINRESEDEESDGDLLVEQLEDNKPTRSSNGFDMLIGMEDVIREIRQKILLPYNKRDLAKKYLHKLLKGALLYGPNGVAKTALARAIAEEANVPMISIPSGGSIKAIMDTYQEAAKQKNGCIVFIDEIDGLLKTSIFGTQGNPYVTALQECIDGYSQNEGVFTIATTNFPGGFPDGLKRSGRLDVHIEIGLPDRPARDKLFQFFLGGLRVSGDIDYHKLSKITATFTGSDIEATVKEAGINAMIASQHNPEAKINNKRLTSAISSYTPTGARIMGLQKPAVSFNDIYGQDDLISSITPQLDLISGKKQAKYSKVSNDTILLYGPPGTGKTFMAQGIADYLDVSFLYRKGASFKDKWVGETERKIREMFAQARTFKPVVLFIDEIDGIGKKRSGADWNRHSEDALSVFLGEMEGVVGNEGIYLIAATNVPEQLDEAVLSRFRRKFHMPKPETSQRRAVLKGLFNELPEELVEFDLDDIASATEGYTQRNLNGLYNEVCMKLDMEETSKVTTAFLQSLITHNY